MVMNFIHIEIEMKISMSVIYIETDFEEDIFSCFVFIVVINK